MWNQRTDSSILLIALAMFALCACEVEVPNPLDSAPPGSGTIYAGDELDCDPATSLYYAPLYAPVPADIIGDWEGQGPWPVTWIFEKKKFTRYDQIPGACSEGIGCEAELQIRTGSYKLQNALLILDWDGSPSIQGMSAPDLLYAKMECTGDVWLFESNMYGEIAYGAM